MPVMGWVATPSGAHWGRLSISLRLCYVCQDSEIRPKTEVVARDGTADGSAVFEKRFYGFRGHEEVKMEAENGEDRRCRCRWVQAGVDGWTEERSRGWRLALATLQNLTAFLITVWQRLVPTLKKPPNYVTVPYTCLYCNLNFLSQTQRINWCKPESRWRRLDKFML